MSSPSSIDPTLTGLADPAPEQLAHSGARLQPFNRLGLEKARADLVYLG